MKRIIAVLLTLMMALSLTACSGDDNAQVAGTWKWNCDITEMFQEGVNQGAGMDLSTDATMEMVFVLKLNEDGTVEEYVQQMMDASIDVDQMMDGLADENESGYYRAAKGKLYLSDKADTFSDDSYAEYTLSGGAMQWTGGDSSFISELADINVELPIQWVKQ